MVIEIHRDGQKAEAMMESKSEKHSIGFYCPPIFPAASGQFLGVILPFPSKFQYGREVSQSDVELLVGSPMADRREAQEEP